MYRVQRSQGYLSHHGILGQKWGKKNGPPYPLGSGDHSASEKKAGWKKSLGGGRNENMYESKRTAQNIKSDHSLTDEQKKWIKRGLIAAGVTMTVVGGMYLVKSGRLAPYIEAGRKAVLNLSGFDSETGLLKTRSNTNINEMINKINNGGCGKTLGRSMNCGNCTIAFEAQRRGFNVTAKANPNGVYISQMGQFFNGLKSDSFREFNKLEVPDITADFVLKNGNFENAVGIRGKQVQSLIQDGLIKSYPDGSRGNLFIPLQYYNHWISWERIGNKIQFYDAQDPTKDLAKEIFGLYKYKPNNISTNLTAIRLDDLEFNTDNLRSMVNNNTGKITGIVDKIMNTKISDFSADIIKGNNFVSNYGMVLQEDLPFRK